MKEFELSGMTFSRAIQLFTLIVHGYKTLSRYLSTGSLGDCYSHYNLEFNETKMKSVLAERFNCMSRFLLSEEVFVVEKTNFSDNDKSIGVISVDTMNCDDGSTIVMPHMMSVLMDLYEFMGKDMPLFDKGATIDNGLITYNPDHNYVHWLGWIIDTLAVKSDPSAYGIYNYNSPIYICEYIAERRATQNNNKKLTKLDKRQKARDKALNKIKLSAKAFTAFTDEDILVNNEIIDPVPGQSRVIDVSEKIDEIGTWSHQEGIDNIYDEEFHNEDLLCIICQRSRTSQKGEPIACLALCQNSRIGIYSESKDPISDGSDGQSDIHVSFCGHAMHFSCFDTFIAGFIFSDIRPDLY